MVRLQQVRETTTERRTVIITPSKDKRGGKATPKKGQQTGEKAAREDRPIAGTSGSAKRRLDSTVVVPVKKTRREKVLFIGDSMFRHMARNRILGTHAWREGWELRIRRGATASELEAGVRKALEQDFDKIVLWVGTNDLFRLSFKGKEAREAGIQESIMQVEKLVDRCLATTRNVGMVLMVSRHKVLEADRMAFNTGVSDAVGRKATCIDIQQDVEKAHFMKEWLDGGIHFSGNKFPIVLTGILNAMQVPTIDMDNLEEAKSRDFLGNSCWRCGEHHKRQGHRYCDVEVSCNRCGKTNHSEKACLSIIFMCTNCGVRGHTEERCRGDL